MSWHLEVSREAEKVLLRQDRRQRLRWLLVRQT